MLTLPLTIRYSDGATREPAAWFIPSGDPAEWLRELAAWRVPLSEIAMHVLPASGDDRRPRGVLAVPQAGASPRVSNRCQPYGRVARRLYIPVEALLGPDVDDHELAAELSPDAAAYVMHPASGLIRFDSDNVLRVSDLLATPSLQAAAWDRAVPGIGINRRLLSVQPDRAPDVAAALELGRDDIGSESPTLEALPPRPAEPHSDPISQAGGQIIGGFAKMVQWLAQHVPKLGGKPTWVNTLENWAKGLSQKQQQSLDELRNREILRLLHLLDSEPDEGLRFALRFDAEPHRGLAPPSARLGEREVNFDLRRMGGGKPADFWNLREEHRRRLVSRYRELANREIQLGRHRRAAYIYAKLLGDYVAAANTLAQGHHYRDAATVYRDKLKRPHNAARCLEQGGFVSEAIAVYEELAEFEKVGDLYVAIDQQDNARTAYLLAVEHQRARDDHLHAARLLEEKLAAPDDALAELAGGWPTSPQAGQCLEEQFHLFARLGRHADAERRLNALDSDRLPSELAELLVDKFAALSIDYPDAQLRLNAADRTRVVVSAQLPGASELSRQRLVSAIGRLVPADRLLPRDCQRFLHQQASPSTIVAPVRTTALKRCSVVSQFKLPNDVSWKSFCSSGDVFYAAGYRDCEVVVIRGRWDGRIHQPAGPLWLVGPRSVGAPILFRAYQRGEPLLLFHIVGDDPIQHHRFFPPTDDFPQNITIYTRSELDAATVAMAGAPHGVTWIARREAGEIVMAAYSVTGKLISTRTLPPVFGNPELQHAIPLPLHARTENVYVGIGDKLVILKSEDQQRFVELPGFIRTLSGSALHSRPRILATFDRGGALFWDDYDAGHMETFAPDIPAPLATLTPRGWLAVVGGGEYSVYGTQDRKLALKATGPSGDGTLIAVVATDHADQFALCDSNGNLSVLQMHIG